MNPVEVTLWRVHWCAWCCNTCPTTHHLGFCLFGGWKKNHQKYSPNWGVKNGDESDRIESVKHQVYQLALWGSCKIDWTHEEHHQFCCSQWYNAPGDWMPAKGMTGPDPDAGNGPKLQLGLHPGCLGSFWQMCWFHCSSDQSSLCKVMANRWQFCGWDVVLFPWQNLMVLFQGAPEKSNWEETLVGPGIFKSISVQSLVNDEVFVAIELGLTTYWRL